MRAITLQIIHEKERLQFRQRHEYGAVVRRHDVTGRSVKGHAGARPFDEPPIQEMSHDLVLHYRMRSLGASIAVLQDIAAALRRVV